MRIGDTETKTDPGGYFALYGLPEGPQLLLVDGTTSPVEGGSYPPFTIHLDILPDSETVIERPIYLPFVDSRNAVMVEPDANTEVMNTEVVPKN